MTDETTIAAEAARDAQNVHEKRRRGWGCFTYAAIAILVPTLTLGLVWAILSIADGQLAAEAMQRARDAGDPLTAAEMRAFYGSTPQSEEATAKWIAALRATDSVGTGAALPDVPILGSSNAAPTLDERGLYDDATLARAEPFLASQGAEALRLAHAARDCASDVRYPIAFEQGYVAHMEYIQELRTLANLLALESEVRAAKGDLTGATDSLLTLIAASETLAEAPETISYLVRLALIGVSTGYAMDSIERSEFSPEDLRRLQDAFARQSVHRQLQRAVQGSQFEALQAYEAPAQQAEFELLRWVPLRGGDQAMTLDLHREFLEAASAGLPEADRAAASADLRLEALSDSGYVEGFRYLVTHELVYGFGPYVNAALRGEAEIRIAATCCACERFRQEHGEWPPKLAVLVPDYLLEVPLDPVDGQPLRYEVEDGRMTIHSIGHFRSENSPGTHTFEDGLVSEVLGEKRHPESRKSGSSLSPREP